MIDNQCQVVLDSLRKMALNPLYTPSKAEMVAAEVLLRKFQYTALPPIVLSRWRLNALSLPDGHEIT